MPGTYEVFRDLILVDFIERRVRGGMALAEAVVERRCGAIPADGVDRGCGHRRLGLILFDPIFQGLAISLMAGEVGSLLLSRVAVPVLYFIAHQYGTARLRESL